MDVEKRLPLEVAVSGRESKKRKVERNKHAHLASSLLRFPFIFHLQSPMCPPVPVGV